MITFGYKASAEQFGPVDLIHYVELAERLGFEIIAVSDHFQPWRHNGGHAPNALTWLGAASAHIQSARLGTSVLTPTMRYHPSVIAQGFATLACLNPGRIFLGVGTGEAMNETPATRQPWPGIKERRMRLAEAIELIRRLWTQDRVDFEGEYYQTARATVYDKPSDKVPIYVAGSGPLAAKLAGRLGDGFICTSGKRPELYEQLLDAVAEGATSRGRNPQEIRTMIEIKIAYDTDQARAESSCAWWAALAATPEEKAGIQDPLEMEQLADGLRDRASSRFIVASDPDSVVAGVTPYIDLGFTELVFHAPGHDQERFLRQFSRDALPVLRERFDRAAALRQPPDPPA